MNIFEKIRLRRLDEARNHDADRRDDDQRREDEARRVAAAEAADIEADLQKEPDEAHDGEHRRKDGGGFDEEERRVPERPYAHDPDPDPGWLDRWEREGTLKDLTPDERAKLEQIDHEDPMGRGMREQFLPREVLAIRSNSERAVEKMRAEREAAKEAEPESEREAAPEEPAAQEREERRTAVVKEQEPDDNMDMEMDR